MTLNFLLDTNVFIEAYRRYYAFDICPGFWACLPQCWRQGQVRSVDRVRDEMTGDDKLAKWVMALPRNFFASTNEPIIAKSFREMSEWVSGSNQFISAAQAEFQRVADGWLVGVCQSPWADSRNPRSIAFEYHKASSNSKFMPAVQGLFCG